MGNIGQHQTTQRHTYVHPLQMLMGQFSCRYINAIDQEYNIHINANVNICVTA